MKTQRKSLSPVDGRPLVFRLSRTWSPPGGKYPDAMLRGRENQPSSGEISYLQQPTSWRFAVMHL